MNMMVTLGLRRNMIECGGNFRIEKERYMIEVSGNFRIGETHD